MMTKSYVLSALCAVSAILPSAAQFLAESSVPLEQQEILEKLKELHLGGDHEHIMPSDQRIASLQQELSTIYAALPKNSRGALRLSTARYLLHRLFVQRHGWHFKGLAPEGDTWDSISPSHVLADRAPEAIAALFRKKNDISLADLAALAALLENMLHSEADVRLAAAFNALDFPLAAQLSLNESTAVLETYMASFVMGSDARELHKNAVSSRATMLQKLEEVVEQYPTWPNTQAFLQMIREEVTPETVNFSFPALSAVVAEAGERYGRWQSHECSELKHQLLQHEEHPNTGRVRLSDFYAMALHGGHWQFSESVAYLRQLGALDESDPEALRVIVPNYILGPSNCIASSGYFAVCCIDECDAKLQSLETTLGKSKAPPAAILSALNATIGRALERKLREVAEHHGGEVPLHGRLFAQWLHHLYPQECPFPHMSGTINPLHPDLFEEEVGQSVGASQEEMMQHLEAAKWRKAANFEEGLCSNMWTMEEELVDPLSSHADTAPEHRATRGALRGLALATAVGSLAVTLGKLMMTLRPEWKSSTPKVYSV